MNAKVQEFMLRGMSQRQAYRLAKRERKEILMEIVGLKKQMHDLCAQSMEVSGKTIDKVSELKDENERLKCELLDAKRDACRFEKAMYRALFNWAHVRTFVYMKEHGMLPLSITPDNLNVPYQWKNALNLCKLGYDFAKAAQDKLSPKTKAPEEKK